MAVLKLLLADTLVLDYRVMSHSDKSYNSAEREYYYWPTGSLSSLKDPRSSRYSFDL